MTPSRLASPVIFRVPHLLGAALAILAGLAGLTAPIAGPWEARQAAGQETGAKDQDRLYAELAAEAAAFEKQFGLLKKLVRAAKPSIVHIDAQKPEGDSARTGRAKTVEEAGSGVIFQHSKRMYVLTNRHVVRDAELARIKIRLADGRVIYPTRVLTDPPTDIAVLEVPSAGLLPCRMGDSDSLEIGDFVVAVGSPFGLSHSVTYGVVSAKGRRDLQLGDDSVRFQEFVQTDAAMNPGNSGGPLLNLRGEVVGINTAIASASGGNEGIGFTIPIKMAMTVATQLAENGRVIRAFLGVQPDAKFGAAEAARRGLPPPFGAKVSAVTPQSPAQEANLQVNDVIVEYDGAEIESDTHLVNLVSLTPVGREVNVLLYRQSKPMTVRVRVASRPGS